MLRLLRWTFEAVVMVAAGFALKTVPEAKAKGTALLIAVLIALWLGVALVMFRRRPGAVSLLQKIVRALDTGAFNASLLLVFLELGNRGLAVVMHNPIALGAGSSADDVLAANLLSPGSTMAGFTINSSGFFDREFTVDKSENTLRILALGDSFAVGNVPYPANYLTLLESLLNARHQQSGKVFEVYNMGVKGVSPPEYAQLLRTRGVQYRPDLVLVGFFVGNDFQDVALVDEHQGALASWFVTPLVVDRLIALLSQWAAAEPPRQRATDELPPYLQRLMTMGGPYDDLYPGLPEIPAFSVDTYLKIERHRLEICRIDARADTRERIRIALAALDEIRDLARGRMIVVAIPDEFQIDARLLGEVLARFGLQASSFDLDTPQRLLSQWCREHQVTLVDLRAALVTGQQKVGRVYKPRDSHWNIRGHRIAAFELAEVLARELDLRR
ncbi:MAG: hypothetical protein U1E76_18675 [Planctomycetota bacterium]